MRPPDLCTGVTKSGEACGFAARRESRLCINHDPGYREQQAENTRRGLEAAHAATRKENRARLAQPGFWQFNLTTRRYTPADIGQFMDSPAHAVYSLVVQDRFGRQDYVHALTPREHRNLHGAAYRGPARARPRAASARAHVARADGLDTDARAPR